MARNEAVLVDSNVVLDVSYRDPDWGLWSRSAIEQAASESVLVINPIVYAEISVGYRSVEDLEDVVPAEVFRREPLPYEAAFLAGKCFLAYRRSGGRRRSPLPDCILEPTRPCGATVCSPAMWRAIERIFHHWR